MDVNINIFEGSVIVEGEDAKVERCERLITFLLEKSKTETLNRAFINFCIEVVDNGDEDKFGELCKVEIGRASCRERVFRAV